VSREFHLVTRERPAGEEFLAALREATGADAGGEPEVDGDFDDPNAYLNVSGPWLWIEVEPPGHVEAADLDGSYDDTTTLPEPDGDLCLWLTVASVPAGAPAGSAETARRTFESLAARYDGIAIDPAE
jgi:hypothetical protein